MTVGASVPAFAEFEAPSEGPMTGAGLVTMPWWTASVRWFAGYDTNVPLVPQTTFFFNLPGADQDSPYLGIQLNAAGYVPVGNGFVLGGAVAASFTGNTDEGVHPDTPRDYSFYHFQPAVFAQWSGAVGDVGVVALGQYSLRREDALDIHAIGLTSHQFTKSLSFVLTDQFTVTLGGKATIDDFDVVFPDPAFDRDGMFWEASLAGAYSLNGGATRLKGVVAAQVNNANGNNWDYTGWSVGGEIDQQIFGPLFGVASATLASRSYNNGHALMAPPGRTSEQILTLQGRLIYHINETFAADFTIRHDQFMSNVGLFTANRTRVSVGVTAELH
jgi:hypothetical protein